MRHRYEAIGCWTEREWPQAFQCSNRKYHTVLRHFFLLVPEKTMHLCPPKRGTEKPKSRKVPPPSHANQSLASYPQIGLASPAPQKYAPKYLHAIFEKHAALHKSLDHIMLPPSIDSTASTWFQIWAAALSPIALVFFVFRATGFTEIEDCRFNPVSPT